jgi:cytochrome c biogenesis protein CcmG/thiol:disulfide interchange protein DsbE
MEELVMKNSRALLRITIAILIAGVFFAIWYANHGAVRKAQTTAPVQGKAQLGGTAPEFQAATTHGFFDLAKSRAPVFLEIFATWCPHCQRETAIIDQLYAKYKGRADFVAVTGSQYGMDRNSPASQADTANFIQAFHVQYPVAFDPTMQVAQEYLQGGYPTLVVINRQKKITYLTSGETPYAELASALNAALK